MGSYALAEKEARALCPSSMINRLKKKPIHRVIIATAVLWLQLLSAWLAALFGPSSLWVPAFLVICACISAMQLWVHESSHYSLFQNRKLNDFWATFFYASPIGMSVRTYRHYHMTHHARLATTGDMDRFAFNVNIKGRKQLIFVFLRGLLCLDAAGIIVKKYTGTGKIFAHETQDFSILATIGWNILLLLTCFLAGRWYLYFALWVYPILGIAVTMNSLRSIGEHQPVGFIGPISENQDITPISRTTIPNCMEKWLMYQSNFNFHFEHHLYPSVPAANLPALHRHLVDQGFYTRHPECIQKSGVAKVFALSLDCGPVAV